MNRVVWSMMFCVAYLWSAPFLEQIQAYFLYKQHAYPQALRMYESLYTQQKLCHNAYNLANVYYKMGIYASAISLYQEGLELPCKDKYYALLWHNLGNALFALGRYVEAYHAFENALRFASNVDTQHNLAITRELLEHEKSIAKIITKPKATDSQEFENTTPLVMPQIATPKDLTDTHLKPW